MNYYRNLINGELAGTEKALQVLNPANLEIVGHAPLLSRQELEHAIEAASQAFSTWKKTSFESRQEVLRQLSRALEQKKSELAKLLTLEQGKPLASAEGEIQRCADWLSYFANLPDLDQLVRYQLDDQVVVGRTPLGVVAAIVPWNFPMSLATWKIAPALLMGNTVVWKPSPFTPLTSLRFGELIKDIVPPRRYKHHHG